ncbi:MAG: PepSY domain-containing protein, partial [Myxococcales bacterium]
MSGRWTFRRVHTWAGIGAGVLLFLTSATGVLLTFRGAFKRADPVVPAELRGRPALPPWELVARAEAEVGAKASELFFSHAPETPVCVVLGDPRATELWFAPSGELLETRHGDEKGLTQLAFELHTGAFLGRGGELAMATAVGALLLLVVSGVVIWPWRLQRAR